MATMYMCVHVSVQVHACIWRPEDNFRCLQVPSTILFLLRPGLLLAWNHQLGEAGGPRTAGVSLSPLPGTSTISTPGCVFEYGGD